MERSLITGNCSLLSGSLALEAHLIGVHCKKRYINVQIQYDTICLWLLALRIQGSSQTVELLKELEATGSDVFRMELRGDIVAKVCEFPFILFMTNCMGRGGLSGRIDA